MSEIKINKEKFEKLLKENRRNINSMLADLHSDTPHADQPPPPIGHVCKFPLWEVGKVNGWSFGYETLPFIDVTVGTQDFINLDLWDRSIDLMAKNAINFIRAFAFCLEDKFYEDHTYASFPKINGKYELSELDQDYVAALKPKLQSCHSRKVVTEVCMVSGIKNLPASDPRWSHSPFNGKNNRNNTTTDHRRFYTDALTKMNYQIYLKNFVKEFDNPYMLYEITPNEPTAGIGTQIAWNNEMVDYMVNELEIPNSRIAVAYFNDGRVYQYPENNIWIAPHAVNSEKTVERWSASAERRPLLDTGRTILCGDGGDEFGEAEGLVGLGHNPDFRKAAARQERNMIRHNLRNGGNGIDFMPAICFLDSKIPNLQRILDHGEDGFTNHELLELEQRLGISIDVELNSPGELSECRAAFTNNI